MLQSDDLLHIIGQGVLWSRKRLGNRVKKGGSRCEKALRRFHKEKAGKCCSLIVYTSEKMKSYGVLWSGKKLRDGVKE